MCDETEMERKIIDFLRRNGESTALMVVKEFRLPRSTVNKHLYKLLSAKQVSRSDDTPPVWDLMEKTSDMKSVLKPEQNAMKSRLKPEQNAMKSRLKAEQTSPKTRDETLEKQVRDVMISGVLKPGPIAIALGQTRQTITKQLYIMQDEGKVQKCNKSNLWTLNDEKNKASYNQKSDHKLGSNSGLSLSFDVISELGEGGYGCVYKVKHKYDGKIYAVKEVVLTGKADSEVKALSSLAHPNIVHYITCWADSKSCTSNQDASEASASSSVVTFEKPSCQGSDDDDDEDEDDDDDDDDDDDVTNDVTSGMESLAVTDDSSSMRLFIQMEFCEGGTLTTWINAGNLLNKQRTAVEIHPISHEIICGVEYIHSNNLIHRDLKPDNILFGSDGKVKIGDFGLVAFQTDHSGDPIERSKRRGTPTYRSPEQENKRNYDEKTDIFPLGLIWFEMLWKISTGSERAKLWPDLRNQRFPDGFCESHPNENIFITAMLSAAPEDRPSAKHIREKLEMFFSVDQNLLSQKTV